MKFPDGNILGRLPINGKNPISNSNMRIPISRCTLRYKMLIDKVIDLHYFVRRLRSDL